MGNAGAAIAMKPEQPPIHRRAGRTDASDVAEPTQSAAVSFRDLPDGYPAHIAEAFARFGDRYDDICVELFTNDPVLGTDPSALPLIPEDISPAQHQIGPVDPRR
ncbi:hypothetical protein [Candidatus Poriferisodalis sp.]|uniref:hypothetical protein n=1 Tax=Candidatus Poriferisodalis sp. TaxID=3101277 RepID=UPI003B52BD58